MSTEAPRPGWLRRSLTRLLALAGVYLLPVAVGGVWPVDAVGNAYQLLGVLIAGLGVPVVAPQLLRAEHWLQRSAEVALGWMQARWAAVKRWLRERRPARTPQTVRLGTATDVSMAGAVGVGGHLALTVRRGTAEEIAALRQQIETLENAHAEHVTELQRQLATQAEELRAHTIAVTEQGWQYILSGAGCSAFGTLLALVG